MTSTYPQSAGMEVGRRSAASSADLIAAGSPVHTKGTWLQQIASTANDAQGIWIDFSFGSPTSAFLVDIGTGAASSEVVVIADIACASSPNWIGAEGGAFFPLHIPAGTRVSARVQSNVLGDTCSCAITMVDVKGTSVGFNTCETIGTISASSRGKSVDAGGVANTKGAYSELVASTSGNYKYCAISIGANGDTSMSADTWSLIDIAIGGAGSEQIILGDIPYVNDTVYDMSIKQVQGLPLNIPKGSRVAARSQCISTAADARVSDVSIHGFYNT